MEAGKANPSGLVSREKYWTERTTDEKLNALRTELVYAIHAANRAKEMFDIMIRHQHAQNGAVLFTADLNQVPPGYNKLPPMALRDKTD